jgi:hypothetical protein
MAPVGQSWWRALFPGSIPDVLELLVTQGNLTRDGLRHFAAWSNAGSDEESKELSRCRSEAFQARRDVLAALQAALSTPLDQEDIYILSERLDRVLNQAWDAVREAEILSWRPDPHLGSMGGALAEGTAALVDGLHLLGHDLAAAGRHADQATKLVRHVEHRYREAMTELMGTSDLRQVIAAQDLYRRYLRVAEAVVAVADRLWYAVLRGA